MYSPEDDYRQLPPGARKGRQFSRGGRVGGMYRAGAGVGNNNMYDGPNGPGTTGPRKFRGQYVRTRSPQADKFDGSNNQQSQNNSHRQQSSSRSQNHSQQQQQQPQQQRVMDEIKEICMKLSSELDIVKTRVNEIAENLERMKQPKTPHTAQASTVNEPKQKKPKALKKRQETNEVNGNRRFKRQGGPKKNFPELSDSELNEIVQNLKREFLASELTPVKKAIDERGPVVAKEFAVAILDHAICDVTSPTKLSDIATNLAQIFMSEDVGFRFQHGFCSALGDISKREQDIAIDAPRYMDTLGQVLGECLVPMNTGRSKQLIKRFLTKSLQSYAQQSRASLLASTMRGIASRKDERFAKEIWDLSNLDWSTYKEGPLEDFLVTQEVQFTTQHFSPEPRTTTRPPEVKEKFADDVTDLVEKRCSTQELEDLVRDLNLEEADEVNDFKGTLIYALVRGCIVTDSGDYKLDTEALNLYSSLLKNQADTIALNALTALTKLNHEYNCPQNLMSNILLALHNHGAASYEALKNWLDSEDLKNVPGIGAARLNSKRCIEELAKTG